MGTERELEQEWEREREQEWEQEQELEQEWEREREREQEWEQEREQEQEQEQELEQEQEQEREPMKKWILRLFLKNFLKTTGIVIGAGLIGSIFALGGWWLGHLEHGYIILIGLSLLSICVLTAWTLTSDQKQRLIFKKITCPYCWFESADFEEKQFGCTKCKRCDKGYCWESKTTIKYEMEKIDEDK